MFGNPEKATGGRALKYYASVRLDVRRIESLKNMGDMVGFRTRVLVVKNKLAAPLKNVELDLMFGKGISAEGDLLDLAVEKNIIKKYSSWYSYKDNRIGSGREAAKEYLREHPSEYNEIEEKLKEAGISA